MANRIFIIILAIAAAYFVVYFAVRLAINHEIKDVVSTTIRDEFQLQEWKWNVFYNP